MEGTTFYYKPELWKELLNQALEKSEKLASDFGSSSSKPIVVVADRDEGATKAAIPNAERAGVL
jgi:23S rRNA G2445 N2-methylase RlmL